MSFTGLDVCIDVFCSAKIIIKFETANNLPYFLSKVPCFMLFSCKTMFHSIQKHTLAQLLKNKFSVGGVPKRLRPKRRPH